MTVSGRVPRSARYAKRTPLGWKKSLLIALFITVLLYTIAVLWLVYMGRQEPQVLTGSFYALVGTELVAIAKLSLEEARIDANTDAKDNPTKRKDVSD